LLSVALYGIVKPAVVFVVSLYYLTMYQL